MFKRPLFQTVRERIDEPRRFIQALMGPRQTGKTTLAQQVLDELEIPKHYATADEPVLKDFTWIEQQGRTYEEIMAQWYDRDYWTSFQRQIPEIDKLIDEFNARVELGK